MPLIPKSFYNKSTANLARDLLGTYLVYDSLAGKLAGKIVETEAYLFRDDPACHASRGKTARNAAMFGPAGRTYVYLIYGMHYCLNIVSGNEHEGEAVLIRALEPVAGLHVMAKHRKTDVVRNLCNGPGKLAQAFGLDLRHNNWSLRTSALKLYSHDSFGGAAISRTTPTMVVTTRIGISKGAELPLRFLIASNEFVSKPG